VQGGLQSSSSNLCGLVLCAEFAPTCPISPAQPTQHTSPALAQPQQQGRQVMIHIPPQPFYFLRHGQTDWNVQHKLMGNKDIPLNPTGVTQAIAAGESLIKESISTIITSPLIRAAQTADIIAAYTQAVVVPMPEFQEVCWGALQGTIPGNDAWLAGWLNGEHLSGAETYAECVHRVRSGLTKALAHKGPVLIVSHGGVYWAIQKILGRPWHDLGNCAAVLHTPPEHPTHPWSMRYLSE